MTLKKILPLSVAALCLLSAATVTVEAQTRKSKARTTATAPSAALVGSFDRGAGEGVYKLWADSTFTGAHKVKGTWTKEGDVYYVKGTAPSMDICGIIIDNVFYEAYSGGDELPAVMTYDPEEQTITIDNAPWLSKPRVRKLSSYREGFNRFTVTWE